MGNVTVTTEDCAKLDEEIFWVRFVRITGIVCALLAILQHVWVMSHLDRNLATVSERCGFAASVFVLLIVAPVGLGMPLVSLGAVGDIKERKKDAYRALLDQDGGATIGELTKRFWKDRAIFFEALQEWMLVDPPNRAEPMERQLRGIA